MGNNIILSERIYVIWKPTFSKMGSELYRDHYVRRISRSPYDMWNEVFGFEGYPVIDNVSTHDDNEIKVALHYKVHREVPAQSYKRFVRELMIKWYANNREYVDGLRIGVDPSSLQVYQ